MAYGGLAGVLACPILLAALGSINGMPSKVGWGFGIFVGLPLGVLLGGIAGAETPQTQGEADAEPGKREPKSDS